MSGGSRSLRELIEANASAAQRGPLTRIGDAQDDDDMERSETVGAAIEGAATTTTDQARQVAALFSNQPSLNTTQGGSNMSHHLEGQQQQALVEPSATLDSSEVVEGDADEGYWEEEEENEYEEYDQRDADQHYHEAAAQHDAEQRALAAVRALHLEQTGCEMDAGQLEAVRALFCMTPRATVQYLDDDDMERPETVGAAIEGAATTSTDSARSASLTPTILQQ